MLFRESSRELWSRLSELIALFTRASLTTPERALGASKFNPVDLSLPLILFCSRKLRSAKANYRVNRCRKVKGGEGFSFLNHHVHANNNFVLCF